MKKLLIVLFMVFVLFGCTAKSDDAVVVSIEPFQNQPAIYTVEINGELQDIVNIDYDLKNVIQTGDIVYIESGEIVGIK